MGRPAVEHVHRRADLGSGMERITVGHGREKAPAAVGMEAKKTVSVRPPSVRRLRPDQRKPYETFTKKLKNNFNELQLSSGKEVIE